MEVYTREEFAQEITQKLGIPRCISCTRMYRANQVPHSLQEAL